MQKSAMTTRPWGIETQPVKNGEAYHSVEFSLKALSYQYQFKLWCMGSSPMCFLAKENSDILRLISLDIYRTEHESTPALPLMRSANPN